MVGHPPDPVCGANEQQETKLEVRREGLRTLDFALEAEKGQ